MATSIASQIPRYFRRNLRSQPTIKKIELLVAALVLVLAVTAFAGIGSVGVATAETQVLPASASRRWVILQNNSTNDIYVKVDSSTNAVTTTNGIKVAAGGGVIAITSTGDSNPSRNIIKAISGAGTNALTYQEGNEN